MSWKSLDGPSRSAFLAGRNAARRDGWMHVARETHVAAVRSEAVRAARKFNQQMVEELRLARRRAVAGLP